MRIPLQKSVATHSGHFEHADRVNRLLVDFLDAQ